MSKSKRLVDLRDGQVRIVRLLGFYKISFIHMLFNRILAFYSIIYGLILLYGLSVPQNHSVALASKVSTLLFWLLITPQFLETVKGLSMSWSRGIVFGRLNDEYVSLVKKRYAGSIIRFYFAAPYLAALLWIIALIAIVGWWG